MKLFLIVRMFSQRHICKRSMYMSKSKIYWQCQMFCSYLLGWIWVEFQWGIWFYCFPLNKMETTHQQLFIVEKTSLCPSISRPKVSSSLCWLFEFPSALASSLWQILKTYKPDMILCLSCSIIFLAQKFMYGKEQECGWRKSLPSGSDEGWYTPGSDVICIFEWRRNGRTSLGLIRLLRFCILEKCQGFSDLRGPWTPQKKQQR